MLLLQMYYEAKSVNTQLIYTHRQLLRQKSALQAAWLTHQQLHSDPARLTHLCRSSQTHSLRHSVSPPPATLQTEPLDVQPSTRISEHVGDTSSFISVQPSSRVQTAVSNCRSNYCGELTGGLWMVDHQDFDVHHQQPTSRHDPSSPVYSTDESSCHWPLSRRWTDSQWSSISVLDVDDRGTDMSRSSSPADDDLDSLFGGDDWWASDQSWRWQCGSEPAQTASWSTSETFSSSSYDVCHRRST